METLLDVITAIFGCIIAIILIIGGVDYKLGTRRWRGRKTDHFDGKHFYNLGWTKKEALRLEQDDKKTGYVYGFLRFIISRKPEKWVKREITPAVVVPTHNEDTFRVTYIGHATVLIQISGINIITDPVYTKRCSPIPFAGPLRHTAPGIALEDLPKIDVILLSHNHYDHMDLATLKKLHDRDAPTLYTGLGNSDYLDKKGIPDGIDMDWWEEMQYEKWGKKLEVTYLPAQHFSARGVLDRNKTLWGGFLIQIKNKTLYFAGDTGYGKFVQHIADRFPDGFDVGLLPIGAYKPRWFLTKIHTGPSEALQMQIDLKIKTGIAIHWGVFPLADDGQDDPIRDLEKARHNPQFHDLDFRLGPSGTVWKI